MNIDLFDTVFMAGWLVYLFGFLLPHRKQNRQNSVLVVKENRIGYLVMVLDFLGMQVLPLIYFATSAFHIYDFPLPLWAGITGGKHIMTWEITGRQKWRFLHNMY